MINFGKYILVSLLSLTINLVYAVNYEQYDKKGMGANSSANNAKTQKSKKIKSSYFSEGAGPLFIIGGVEYNIDDFKNLKGTKSSSGKSKSQKTNTSGSGISILDDGSVIIVDGVKYNLDDLKKVKRTKSSSGRSKSHKSNTTGSRIFILDDDSVIIVDGDENCLNDIIESNIRGELDNLNNGNVVSSRMKDLRSSETRGRYEKPGKIITREISLDYNISKIQNYLPLDITYVYTDSGRGKVVLTGPDNFLDDLTIRSYGDYVEFRCLTNNENRIDFSKIKATVYLTTLHEVTIFGTGNFSASTVNSPSFVLNILGTGDANINKIISTMTKIQISGTGDLKSDLISGTIVQFFLSGTGDITLKYLDTTTFIYSSYGTGDLKLTSLKSTSVDLNSRGTGDISISEVDATSMKAASEGNSDVVLNNINVNTLSLIQRGNGTIRVSGNANQVSQEGNSGDINISKLKYNIKSYSPNMRDNW